MPDPVSLLARRHRFERRFRAAGQAAIALALVILVVLLGSIVIRGVPGFFETQIRLPVRMEAEALQAGRSDAGRLVQEALRSVRPEVTDRAEFLPLYALVSIGAGRDVAAQTRDTPAMLGTTQEVWLTASDELHLFRQNDVASNGGGLSVSQRCWAEALEREGRVRTVLSRNFFGNADSREPEMAGVAGALAGSLLTVAACLLLAFPIGVLSALYLEEFAPRNCMAEIIEVNINNLAAVPSIIFGLLGLSLYLNLFGLPRSAPLVGGMTLALMILPTIIISTRAAIRAVPASQRDAARGLRASPLQVALHHVLPLAMPGIMTGTILGIARALGETAPLLMIGMVAFIADVPGGVADPATVLPVQIYLWSDSPERAFAAKTAAAILVLLAVLITLNAVAVYIRRGFEKKW